MPRASRSSGSPAGLRPPLHIHDKTSHAWYVLEGEVRLTLGTDPLSVRAGGFVYVPAGLAHTFANVGSHPARMVQFTTPGGFERYLAELTEAFPEGTAIDPQAIAEIMARHDTRPLPAGD